MTPEEITSEGKKLAGFSVLTPGPRQVLLQRGLGLSLGCGFLGLICLLAGIALGIYVGISLFTHSNDNGESSRSAFKFVLFLLAAGFVGSAILFGTRSVLFDAENATIVRRRLLGLIREVTHKNQLASVEYGIKAEGAFPCCSFRIHTTAGKPLTYDVQFRVQDVQARTLTRLAIWIAEQFSIPFQLQMDPRIPPELLPQGEFLALLRQAETRKP